MAVLDTVRVFNKHLLNPAMMRMAGRKHWYAAVIEHVGRHSGKKYATPVVAEQASDGFIIPLPYGTHTDWLRNVLAAGQATIRVHGETYEAVAPQIIDAATAAPRLNPRRRRAFDRFKVKSYLEMKPAPTPSAQR
ncbi:nitroreductase family deazaflavin-dependent oxidoreductase [Mycobacterium simiae]|uniref:Nitroreductase family deazaflavin-dependent oxidoreductase n=1 Tax=Mycobacterium simiae TaxID=1784 RepID=A0A5B1BPD8_MYCSI|nr:nitroreductase family deazaflavin-dependent oxidoreductase [Mycobacterium simiae]KAA1249280.1 nitroreductase family deazaflavin-dependent oxidoreductase [Mycobacterium simiae]